MTQKRLELEDIRYLVANLRKKARDEALASGWDGDVETISQSFWDLSKGYGYVGLHDGKPAYGGSVTEVYPGAFQFWSLATEDFAKIMLTVTKFVRRVMLPEIFQRGAWRVEARCIGGDDEVQKWMTLLGAKLEETQKSAGRNGEDFLIYVWSANDVRR